MMLASYVGGVRPIKIRLKTHTATKEILARTFRLKDWEDYNQISIKKNMNEEVTKIERNKGRGKLEKCCENDKGKNKVFFGVMDNKLRKMVKKRK